MGFRVFPLALLVAGCVPFSGTDRTDGAATGFQASYVAGSHDAAGSYMGGTELRVLAAHKGRLYAGNGYWEDRPGLEGPQGAQILVLEQGGRGWRVDHVFGERIPNGRRRDFAISALRSVTFTTGGSGSPLPEPVAMLLASSWDRTGATRVFSRDDADGAWVATTLAEDRRSANFLPQLRSFGFHRDKETGTDHVFAGNDPRGIFGGVYDARVSGRIRWAAKPELDISAVPTAWFPGLEGRLRVTSFAECNGRLYAAVGQQVYERVDGSEARWRLAYSNPRPGYSQTGLRGLTSIPNASGTGEVMLAAVEGSSARIVRIDPADGAEATDLDVVAFLNAAWHTRVSYVIAAYNDMAKVSDPRLGDLLLIGLEAFIPPAAPRPPGHSILNVVNGLEGGAWYLVRHADGRYDLRQVDADLPKTRRDLVATRAILASPFPNDDAIYFAGYDANGSPAHDTAWIVRAPRRVALTGGE